MSNGHTASAQALPLNPSERKMVAAFACVVGVLSIAGWAAAMWLALIPVEGGTGSTTQKCGVPALFNRASEQEKLSPHGDGTGLFSDDAASYWANICADAVGGRINSAVGAMAVTLPISALWFWCALTLKSEKSRRPEVE
jgi:hypothetical protein